MIAPPSNPNPQKRNDVNYRCIAAVSAVLIAASVAVVFCIPRNGAPQDETSQKRQGKTSDTGHHPRAAEKSPQTGIEVDHVEKPEAIVVEPKTNQWGNPAHWGHKKLRPAMVHSIDRSQMPLFEQLFQNSADKTIAGLLVIEPGTDLIGDDTFDESFVKAFLKSIESPIVVSKEDSEEAKALKRAVIETKIDLKARLDAGEDIAKTLTDIRCELRELGAYREEIKALIHERSRDHAMNTDDMKDFVAAANIMLDERGAKPIVMPEFYYKQLEIRNQKIKALKGE